MKLTPEQISNLRQQAESSRIRTTKILDDILKKGLEPGVMSEIKYQEASSDVNKQIIPIPDIENIRVGGRISTNNVYVASGTSLLTENVEYEVFVDSEYVKVNGASVLYYTPMNYTVHTNVMCTGGVKNIVIAHFGFEEDEFLYERVSTLLRRMRSAANTLAKDYDSFEIRNLEVQLQLVTNAFISDFIFDRMGRDKYANEIIAAQKKMLDKLNAGKLETAEKDAARLAITVQKYYEHIQYLEQKILESPAADKLSAYLMFNPQKDRFPAETVDVTDIEEPPVPDEFF